MKGMRITSDTTLICKVFFPFHCLEYLTIYSSFVDRDMFARFCGFGPGLKSTHRVTKVFRDEIREAFGIEHDKDNMGDREGDHDEPEDADEKVFEGDSDGDGESEENSDSESDLWDHGDGLDYLAFEEELGYAPL
jgi:hypothetical protein